MGVIGAVRVSCRRMARVKKRILVLFRPKDPSDPAAGTASMGSPREVREAVAGFNTAPDGTPRKNMGTEVLFGPGFILEIAQGQDEIMQAMVTANEPDTAWPVLSRICRANEWKLQDAESGQVFG